MLERLTANMSSQCELRSAVIPMSVTGYGECSDLSQDSIKVTIWFLVSSMIIIL